jgi:hypothetical protein
MLMPAFHRFPNEAAIIGRIIPAYGEIEFILAWCLGNSLGEPNTGMRLLYRLRSEANRVDIADALMSGPIAELVLEKEYQDTINAVRFCKSIRNQYAHCHWADDLKKGLYFVNVEEATKNLTLHFVWRPVNVALLQEQEEYFVYCIECLNFLSEEMKIRKKGLLHNYLSMPKGRQTPKKHNLPVKHTPPWTETNP